MRSGGILYVDETKRHRYVMVAVAVPYERVDRLHSAIARLILPGQRSIHMKNESARRRTQILNAINQLLIELVRTVDGSVPIRYEHARASSQPGLACADGVAWAWARGGEWRSRVAGIVTCVRGDL